MQTMECVLPDLQCPVCLELYRTPTILPCSHILCRTPCAERLFAGDFVRCPVCRDNCFVTGGIETLPRVISLEHIIEQYQSAHVEVDEDAVVVVEEDVEEEEICGPTDIACQLCDADPQRRAHKSCLDCNASYCQTCLSLSHPNKEPFSGHQLVLPLRYPKPREARCRHHDVRVNIYCVDCEQLACLLCADDPSAHPAHRVLGLQEATAVVKGELETALQQLTTSQEVIQGSVDTETQLQQQFQETICGRREHINSQCDAMMETLQSRRHFFLSDLEYEEHNKNEMMSNHLGTFRGHHGNLQSLTHYTREVLKETDHCAFLQLAKAVKERVRKGLEACTDAAPSSPGATSLHHKFVDLRKELALLRDMSYLTVPHTPVIDEPACLHSTTSVVLVLGAPDPEYEVLDGYIVYFGTEDQKNASKWDLVEFKTPGEEKKVGRGPPYSNTVCLIHDNLEPGTQYFFTVRAYNAAGNSSTSAMAMCDTLCESQTTLPVPEINESMCHTYSHSIQIHSPSPAVVPSDDKVTHFLLYRESSVNKIWKSIPLFNRVDHRVFGLLGNTNYDFVIMACKNRECQVSNKVTMVTEPNQ